MSCRIEDARHWLDSRSRPSVSGMNTAVPKRNSHRAWSIGGPVFGALWLAAPVVAFGFTDPAGWQIALVAVGVPVFAALFLYVVTTEQPVLRPVGAMIAIA